MHTSAECPCIAVHTKLLIIINIRDFGSCDYVLDIIVIKIFGLFSSFLNGYNCYKHYYIDLTE